MIDSLGVLHPTSSELVRVYNYNIIVITYNYSYNIVVLKYYLHILKKKKKKSNIYQCFLKIGFHFEIFLECACALKKKLTL